MKEVLSMQSMTASVSKGKTNESSSKHNDRKTNLEKADEEKRKKFYEQKGHQHIHAEYTHLNIDMIKDPKKIYDEQFEKAIKEYNAKQTRNSRKIGQGKALTRKEKEDRITMLEYVDKYRKLNRTQKRYFVNNLPSKAKKPFMELQKSYASKSLRDIRRDLTRAKHAETLGEAYYNKQKHSKQASTHTELIFQVGSAEDFNEVDENGRIVKSYDRTDPNGIWQKSKKVLQKFEKKFEENNPNLIVTNYSIHMDESTPHMHIEVIPVAEQSKTTPRGTKNKRRNGLTKRVSFDGALECEGFKRDTHDSRKAFKAWQNKQADDLAKIMQEELGVTRKRGITNRLKDVHEYKQVKEAIAKNREKAHEQDKEISRAETLLTIINKSVDDMQSQQKDAEKKRDSAVLARQQAEKAREKAEKDAKNANAILISQLNNKKEKLDKRKKDLDARETAIIKREKEQEKKAQELTKRENAVKKLENAFKKIPRAVKRFFKSYFTEKNRQRGLDDSQASVYAEQYLQTNPHAGEQVKFDLQAHDRASISAFKTSLPQLGVVIPEVDNLAQSVAEYVKTQKKDAYKEAQQKQRVGAVMREPDRATDPKQEKDKEKEENPFEDNL